MFCALDQGYFVLAFVCGMACGPTGLSKDLAIHTHPPAIQQ